MPGFGSMAPYDPMFPAPEDYLPDVGAPLIPAGPAWAGTRLGNRLFGAGTEERFQTWPEKLVRSAFTLPGDVASGAQPMLPPGLRREDYTDAAPPQEHGPGTEPGVFGPMFTPQVAQPNDPAYLRAQDTAGVAGGGMMFGSLARPAGMGLGRDVRVMGRKVGSGEPFPHQLVDQPAAVPEPYIPLGPVDRMTRPVEARIDSEIGRHANDRSLTSVTNTGARLLEDSSFTGAPIAALEKSVNWKNIEAAERALSPEAARALDNWVGGTVDTMAQMEKGHHPGWGIFNRDALQKNPAVVEELSAAFKPLRDQLKAEHGDTVTLYRYRGDIPEDAKPHEMLSFTTDKDIAEGLSGAKKAVPLIPESEIAAKEAEFEKAGRVQISKNTWLEKKTDTIWNGKEEVPVEYIAIMRPDGMVTDTPSVREYFADENEWRQKDLDSRTKKLDKVSAYQIPVDDIVAATNRFGQKEFVVRNRSGLFEDAAAPGAPISALEKGPASAYHSLIDPPAAPAYKTPHGQESAAAAPEAAPRGNEPGGAGGGDARISEAAAAAARWAGPHQPLEGLPTKAMKIGDEYFVPGPIAKVRDVAADYMANRETPSYHKPPTKYHPLDEEHSTAIARAFDEMKHDPDNPAVKASYDALINETIAQYKAIEKTGLKVEPITPDMPDPYAANPRLAAKDVAENNHLWYFPTDQGFGSNPAAGIDMAKHPMMRDTGIKLGDQPLLANDLFRIVHDYFGHLKEGYGFRAAGEDNAWRSHASMYSDLARPAMTTETRGQNSWVNYGPHGASNRKASAAETKYADQKVGLMPEWTMRDHGSPEPTIAYHGSPYSFDKFDPAHIGAGEGNQAYGHGLYFAGHEPVSEWYRHQLAARRDPLLKKYGLDTEDGANVGLQIAAHGGDVAKYRSTLQQHLDILKKDPDTSKAHRNEIARTEGKIAYLKDPNRAKGHMYEVAIDAKPENFIDWDKSFSEQPAYVQERLRPELEARQERLDASKEDRLARHRERLANPKIGPNERARLEKTVRALMSPEDYRAFSGERIYGLIAGQQPNRSVAAPIASQKLKEIGIPGIRYLDQDSRSRGKGTSNYVAFDAPRLLRKYAIPGLIGAGSFGSMAREDQ